jgi:hypothetical protein
VRRETGSQAGTSHRSRLTSHVGQGEIYTPPGAVESGLPLDLGPSGIYNSPSLSATRAGSEPRRKRGCLAPNQVGRQGHAKGQARHRPESSAPEPAQDRAQASPRGDYRAGSRGRVSHGGPTAGSGGPEEPDSPERRRPAEEPVGQGGGGGEEIAISYQLSAVSDIANPPREASEGRLFLGTGRHRQLIADSR